VSQYQKGKTNLDFTEARDSEWQWNQLGHMQVCTSLQTDNHASTPPLSFSQAGCPSCRPTNRVKALYKIITKIGSCVGVTVFTTVCHECFWTLTTFASLYTQFVLRSLYVLLDHVMHLLIFLP